MSPLQQEVFTGARSLHEAYDCDCILANVSFPVHFVAKSSPQPTETKAKTAVAAAQEAGDHRQSPGLPLLSPWRCRGCPETSKPLRGFLEWNAVTWRSPLMRIGFLYGSPGTKSVDSPFSVQWLRRGAECVAIWKLLRLSLACFCFHSFVRASNYVDFLCFLPSSHSCSDFSRKILGKKSIENRAGHISNRIWRYAMTIP